MRIIQEQGHTFEEWITPPQIAASIQTVADRISEDYKNKNPLYIVVLNGAFMFASDLIRRINLHCKVTFIRLKSYESTASTGKINFLVPLQQNIEGRDVIVLEDIVDTGLTIHQLKAFLVEQGAASIRVATMLFKPDKLQYHDAEPDYTAQRITDEFVIGYGLDWEGFCRNLDAIYKLKE